MTGRCEDRDGNTEVFAPGSSPEHIHADSH